MIKIIGIVFVTISLSVAGYLKAISIKEDIAVRKSLYELILLIKNRISTGGISLFDIYKDFSSEVLTKHGFTQKLTSKESNSLLYSLSTTDLRLPEEYKKLMCDFAADLGKSPYIKSELEQLDRYIYSVEKMNDELLKKDSARLILYKKLGLLGGLLAGIILL